MSTCKISIIIPIHNSQSYLKRCIESCIAQTIDSFEVILIDDCSSDDSPKIIAEYVSLYPNTIQAIYLKENMRQGGARNQGILAAKGEYIAFVDSDDWIDPDMCEVLYNAAMGADMSGANMIIESDTSKKISLDYQTSLFDSDLRLQYIQSCGLFWTRIYRKQFIIDNSIFFPPHDLRRCLLQFSYSIIRQGCCKIRWILLSLCADTQFFCSLAKCTATLQSY